MGIEDIFQKHNENPQMQPRLPDLVIMHHMCIQSMHAYEKHRDRGRERLREIEREEVPERTSESRRLSKTIIHST